VKAEWAMICTVHNLRKLALATAWAPSWYRYDPQQLNRQAPSILWPKKKLAFEQRMDIVLTYWHWLEYDSVALAVLFTGIGLVTLLVLSIW
jgi:hypothetical protein